MQKNKALSLLGLMARSRNIISGEELVIKGIQSEKVYFVIITEDASDNIKKKVMDKCEFYDVPYKIVFSREELGHAIGKFERVVVAITDQGFSLALEKLL